MTDFRDRERRARPRVNEPFPVTVRGIDVTGERLDIDTVLDNVSGEGLYVRLPRWIAPGSRLAVGIRLGEPGTKEPGARVAARAVVLRVESRASGQHGLAVGFTKHRFF